MRSIITVRKTQAVGVTLKWRRPIKFYPFDARLTPVTDLPGRKTPVVSTDDVIFETGRDNRFI